MGRCLAYNSTSIPNLSIIFPIFLHNISYTTWITPSFDYKHLSMCVHTSHQPYEYPPFMLCSWQRTHWNPWCNSRHLYHHCVRCWFPCGTKIITCISFNHIQLLSLMNQHCVYQRWHSHLNRCCHCRPNVSKFISLILHNSKICRLWCSSSQGKDLLQPTTHWLIPPFSNWSIWLFI
jgi:hypothetical protein